MLKENYLSAENIKQKTNEWLHKLKDYSRKGKADLDKSALLAIDMQNYFLNEKSHAYVPSAKTIMPNIKIIIDGFRENNLPIIFTRFSLDKNDRGMMAKWWSEKIIEGSYGSKIIKELNPGKDIIIRKKKYSAFAGTRLNSILEKKGIKTIIITGVMTHLCCDATARDAFMHDFNVYFVIDATASYNEDLHLSSLKALSHGFANPIRTGELIEKIKNL